MKRSKGELEGQHNRQRRQRSQHTNNHSEITYSAGFKELRSTMLPTLSIFPSDWVNAANDIHISTPENVEGLIKRFVHETHRQRPSSEEPQPKKPSACFSCSLVLRITVSLDHSMKQLRQQRITLANIKSGRTHLTPMVWNGRFRCTHRYGGSSTSSYACGGNGIRL